MTSRLTRWQQAVRDASGEVLPPSAKLVLAMLSFFMDKDCRCFPCTKTQALKTGLSERTVCTHLEIAVKAGFLKKSLSGRKGKAWSRQHYEGAIPEGAETIAEGTETAGVKALKPFQSNFTRELEEEEPPPRDFIFEGRIIRIGREEWQRRRQSYGLTDRQLADWMNDRDRWLRRLPSGDARLLNWWSSTWQALERDLDGVRRSCAGASPARS